MRNLNQSKKIDALNQTNKRSKHHNQINTELDPITQINMGFEGLRWQRNQWLTLNQIHESFDRLNQNNTGLLPLNQINMVLGLLNQINRKFGT